MNLDAARAAMAQAKRQNADFFFPETATWSDGVQRRFKVTDPTRATPGAALQNSLDPLTASLRTVKFHPDDVVMDRPETLPTVGTSVSHRGETLVINSLTDQGNLFGSRTFVARLISPRLFRAAHWLFDRVAELTRAEMDAVLSVLSQQSRVIEGVSTPFPAEPDAEPIFGEVSLDGGVSYPPTSDPTTQPLGQAESNQRYPAYARQLPESRRQQYGSLGADISVPLWEVLVRRDAPLERPVVKLVLTGGHLPAPLYLEAVGDAEDVSSLGIVWRVVCRAPGER